jgi:hypothetical protein
MKSLLVVTHDFGTIAALDRIPAEVTVVDSLALAELHMIVEGPDVYLLAYGPDFLNGYLVDAPPPEPDLVVYPDGSEVFVNWAAVMLLGVDAYEIPRRRVAVLELLDGADVPSSSTPKDA